jgi:hypothetical protein
VEAEKAGAIHTLRSTRKVVSIKQFPGERYKIVQVGNMRIAQAQVRDMRYKKIRCVLSTDCTMLTVE